MTSSPLTALTLRCLTLNCWSVHVSTLLLLLTLAVVYRGLKYVAKFREERLRAIGDALADMTAAAQQDGKTPFAFVALQECWVYSDFEYIRARLAENGTLKHAKYFWTYVIALSARDHGLIRLHSGALGAGLAIFSAYPIRESHTWAYSLNGSPLDVAGGDWVSSSPNHHGCPS